MYTGPRRQENSYREPTKDFNSVSNTQNNKYGPVVCGHGTLDVCVYMSVCTLECNAICHIHKHMCSYIYNVAKNVL